MSLTYLTIFTAQINRIHSFFSIPNKATTSTGKQAYTEFWQWKEKGACVWTCSVFIVAITYTAAVKPTNIKVEIYCTTTQ